MPKNEIAERVDEAMAMLELRPVRQAQAAISFPAASGSAWRSPARSPRSPAIVLLDEPLGALDKKLRQQTQFELMRIQETTGTTFIIVTHDQEEAMTVAEPHRRHGEGQARSGRDARRDLREPEDPLHRRLHRRREYLRGQRSRRSATAASRSMRRTAINSRRAAREPVDGRSAGVAGAAARRRSASRTSSRRARSTPFRGKVEDIGYLGSISHYHVRTAPGERITALRANAAHTVEQPISWEDSVWLDWPVDAGVVLTG